MHLLQNRCKGTKFIPNMQIFLHFFSIFLHFAAHCHPYIPLIFLASTSHLPRIYLSSSPHFPLFICIKSRINSRKLVGD